jgi:hypothetical protein
LKQVEARCGVRIDFTEHKHLYYVFSIRPTSGEDRNSSDTDITYCHYDQDHYDYVYKESWVDFVVSILENCEVTLEQIIVRNKNRQRLSRDTRKILTSCSSEESEARF